jgi:predicted dehydrogenase
MSPDPAVTDPPLRVAVIGLGQIAELCLPPYAARDDVEVVALCDREPARRDRWAADFPDATVTDAIDRVLATAPDVVDVLVPTPQHADVATQVLEAGIDVQVQKPIARSLDDADRMIAAASRSGASLRVLEDYLFYPPLVKLREVARGGEIGDPVAVHMKIVASGRGGWDVPLSSYVWQFEQARDGRGILTFDHGWHQVAVAYWLFGPIRRVFGWIGSSQAAPELAPDIMIDAPATFVWEHESGVRGVLDIALARDMFFRSDYYTGDERIEVTGTRGYARCNRISAQGIQEPALVVYRDGETVEHHAIPDRPPDAFAAMIAAGIERPRGTAGATPLLGATDAREVLRTLLAALESSTRSAPVDL